MVRRMKHCTAFTTDMQLFPSRLLAFVVVAAIGPILQTVQGSPYFLLQNKAPKCFQMDSPANVKLTIKYHVPGACRSKRRREWKYIFTHDMTVHITPTDAFFLNLSKFPQTLLSLMI